MEHVNLGLTCRCGSGKKAEWRHNYRLYCEDCRPKEKIRLVGFEKLSFLNPPISIGK
jgi:hypothetical protein